MTATRSLDRAEITGLVLAGGRGSRMGGVDKGLQPLQDDAGTTPLAFAALRRLAPQVGRLMVSANRHLHVYRAFGAPVVADDAMASNGSVAFDGPLAGILAALSRCDTPWLACVPCDAPRFPLDLVERLAAGALAEGRRLAIACTPARPQPVFCLLHADLQPALRDFLAGGGRAALRWADAHGAARVAFADDDAFFNANTPADLASAQHRHAA